jgi:hypothetical protein
LAIVRAAQISASLKFGIGTINFVIYLIKMKRIFFILFFNLIVYSPILFAQSSTSSPYSMFGIGDIKPLGFGRNVALGGAGIALPSDVSLNNINPASYSAIDSLMFKFETGLDMKISMYSKGSQDQLNHNVNFSYLALGFRNNRWWTNSIGIAPYSSVGNNINITSDINGGEEEMNTNFQGSGGLNQLYWGNAFRLFPSFSVGVNTSFVFGTITQQENITSSAYSGTVTTEDETYLNRICFSYGAQYKFKLGGKIDAVLGGVVGTPQKFRMNHTITYTDNSDEPLDTVNGTKTTFTIPAFYGGGLSVKYNKFLFTTDYKFESWSKSKSYQENIKLVDAQSFIFGVEYLPAQSFRDPYYKKITYRMGIYYTDSYMKIYGQQLKEKGLSVGLGIPMMQKKMMINVSYQVGINGVDGNDKIINETFQKVILNVSFSDFWFVKPKFD